MLILTYNNLGRITSVESGPQIYVAEKLLENNTATLPDVDFKGIEFHYITNDSVVLRPIQQTILSNTPVITNGVDSGLLQYLPIPCTVFIDDTSYEVNDGTLEFTLNLPGVYKIKVTNCFPYLDKEFICEGIAPV